LICHNEGGSNLVLLVFPAKAGTHAAHTHRRFAGVTEKLA